MSEDLAWAEHELFHVKKAIGAELSKEIGDDKGPALDALLCRAPPSGTCGFIDLDLRHLQPEALDAAKRLQHGCTLGVFIASPASLPVATRLETAQVQQIVDMGNGVILGCPGLPEPQCAQRV